MKKSLLLLFGFAILTSCSDNNPGSKNGPEIIEIDVKNKNRVKLNISLEDVIPLETSPNSIIGYVGMVKYFKNRYYVLNNNRFKKPTLFAFDSKGDLINKTVIGKGPGEVIEPFAFAINEENSIIILHDQAQNPSYIYDLDLNFIRRIKHEHIFNSDFYHVNKDTFLVAHHVPKDRSNNPADSECYTYTIYTEGFTEAKHLDILVKGNQGLSLLKPVSAFNKEILFVAPYNYNIYQLKKGNVTIRYTLDFGDLAFSPNELRTISDDDYGDYVGSGKRIAVGGIYKTKNYLAILTVYEGKALTFFQSLKSKKIYCLDDCVDSNIIPQGFIIWGVTDDGAFYGLVEPEEMIEFKKKTGNFNEYSVDENDNPYILIFKPSEPTNQ